MVNLEYVKAHLNKPVQFICVQVSYRAHSSSKQALISDVVYWLRNIDEGKVVPDDNGKITGPFVNVRCTGDKDTCKGVQAERRFYRQTMGSTSRLVQLGYWRDSWVILPADEHGHWVPTTAYIKAALEILSK